ncbi:MAG: DPP IV N-terminal domain-containing protein [Bacteroidales bacterium]
MKRLFISIILLFNIFVAANAQDFYEQYKAMDSLSQISKLVLNSVNKAKWCDSTLYYQINGETGIKYYSLNACTKECKEQKEPYAPQSKKEQKEKQENLLSPNGKYEAYIEDSNVWIKEITTNIKTKLSCDGTNNSFYEEIHWSPDSKKIAAIKKQDSPMRRIPLIESSPKNQKQPILQWRDYYKPGDLIPIYRPALFNIETKKQVEIDSKPFENQFYLSFERWKNNSEAFTFVFNQRGHQVYQIVDVCAASGKTNIVVDERAKTFIHYYRTYLKYIDNDSSLIWASERSGWNHLYLIDAKTGDVKKQITAGEWVVRDVIDANEKEGYILLSGSGKNKGEDPYNLHYYKVYYKANSSVIEELTPEKENHIVLFNNNNTYFLDTYSAPDKAPISVIKKTSDGSKVHNFGQADISKLVATGWKEPIVFSAKGRDGKTDIWGNIYLPANYNPQMKYPVVEYIYAGPHDSFVEKNFRAYDRFSKLANLGFIIVSIDGMGTANRSKAFHDVCWRNLKDAGYPDRILWIKAAAKKYKFMDITNGVGVYGYSAGGQNTMSALLFFGDFYKVGVALCGCHDNRMDKIWWNEQWMGYPLGEWYSESSNVDNAYRLNGKLLLINGELDDNVDPTSTLQVVGALVKANKHFEQLYLPGYTHNLGDNYVTGRIFEFFWRNMK